jgi:hypothetical protein
MRKRVVRLSERDVESLVKKIMKESPEFTGGMGKARMADYNTFKPEEKKENYMFFQNLKDIKENIETLLSMDETEVDQMLSNGHDWATEHIATAKDDIEEVTKFLKHRKTK